VDEFRQLIKICDRYNVENYVFHSKTGKQEEGLWDLRKPALVRSFRELTEMTKNNICMENMVSSFPCTIDGMIEILQQVEKGKCCIDMNHFLQDKPADAILALRDRLTTIHVSDYDGVYEKHWLPKQGVNNWMKIIHALETIGYKGVFTYEVGTPSQAYSYAEIRANYDELFEEYDKYSVH
jgi:sugar phosphate isomerase/epimerase